jgi:hypothetical protein
MSLINTRLQAFRATSNVDKWETRASRWGGLDLFRQQTLDPNGIISDDLRQKAIAAVGSDLQIPVLDFDSGVTVQNVTQPVTIVGDPSTSQLMAVTFVQYYWGFRIFPAQHFNNEISMQREFNEQMRKYIYKFSDELDLAAIASLEAAKTQVLADDLGGRYSLTANTIVAPLAEQDAVIGNINPLMAGNDFYGPHHVLANPSLESHIRNRLIEKGQFNTEDKTYQYNDKTFHFTNNVSNAVGQKATGYAVQAGSVGMVQQFGADAVMGNTTHKHVWGIEQLPMLGMPIGVYQYEDAIDASGVGGAATAHLTASKVEAYGFHTAVAFITPYNSDAANNASAIAKVAIATT